MLQNQKGHKKELKYWMLVYQHCLVHSLTLFWTSPSCSFQDTSAISRPSSKQSGYEPFDATWSWDMYLVLLCNEQSPKKTWLRLFHFTRTYEDLQRKRWLKNLRLLSSLAFRGVHQTGESQVPVAACIFSLSRHGQSTKRGHRDRSSESLTWPCISCKG